GRCPTPTSAVAGKQLSANLGTGCGESGSATTSVAPSPLGANAHPDHESAACTSDERRLLLEEKAVQRTRASTVRKVSVSSLGRSPPARVVGATGPYEAEDSRSNRSRRTGSPEATGGDAADDASRCRSADGARLRVDHRNSDAV